MINKLLQYDTERQLSAVKHKYDVIPSVESDVELEDIGIENVRKEI